MEFGQHLVHLQYGQNGVKRVWTEMDMNISIKLLKLVILLEILLQMIQQVQHIKQMIMFLMDGMMIQSLLQKQFHIYGLVLERKQMEFGEVLLDLLYGLNLLKKVIILNLDIKITLLQNRILLQINQQIIQMVHQVVGDILLLLLILLMENLHG